MNFVGLDPDHSDTNESGGLSNCDCVDIVSRGNEDQGGCAKSTGGSVTKFSIDTILGIRPSREKGDKEVRDCVEICRRREGYFSSAECLGM